MGTVWLSKSSAANTIAFTLATAYSSCTITHLLQQKGERIDWLKLKLTKKKYFKFQFCFDFSSPLHFLNWNQAPSPHPAPVTFNKVHCHFAYMFYQNLKFK